MILLAFSLASFLVCFYISRQPTQLPAHGGREGRLAGRLGCDLAWGLQSATSHMGSTNPHTQLLTSAGPLKVAGDRTTSGHGEQCRGAGLCFPSVAKNHVLTILKKRRSSPFLGHLLFFVLPPFSHLPALAAIPSLGQCTHSFMPSRKGGWARKEEKA